MDAQARSPRCGRISYTNDLPVYAAFDLGALEFPGTLHADVPSALNRALLAGELDISPVSSFFYAQHVDELVKLSGVCIGSRREAKSIQCISRTHPRDLSGARVAVTTDSATGRALFDVICRTGYGFAPAFEPSADPLAEFQRSGMPCVLIGDAAIDAALAHPEHAHDIGELWHGFTGADMVYAVWVMRKDSALREMRDGERASAKILEALLASLKYGRQHKADVINLAQTQRPRPLGFYEAYYEALNYSYDARAQMGFGKFCTMAQACGVLDPALRIPETSEITEFVYDV
jgi:chorismate dehydratase